MATVSDLLAKAAQAAENQRKQREAAQAISAAIGRPRPAGPQPAGESGQPPTGQ